MRILVVTPYYKPAYVYGGPVRSVSALCEGLVRQGQDVTVFTTNANRNASQLNNVCGDITIIDNVKVRYFPLASYGSSIWPFLSPALGKACRTDIRQYQIVYTVGSWTYPNWVSAHFAVCEGVPYVVSPRGSFMSWSMGQGRLKKQIYLRLMERKVVNCASIIHATTHLEAQQLKQWNFAPPPIIVSNGVDVEKFRHLPDSGALRTALGISATDTVSLFVGRLHKEKQIELMIDAFAQLVIRFPQAHLVIVGPDEDGIGEQMRRNVKQLNIEHCIHFVGLLTGEKLLQAYSDADLLVLLSHRENFGMVVAEAMSAGIPVLLSRNVGLAQEVTEAQAGVVVDPNIHSVLQAWDKLLSDSSMRLRMANAGQTYALAKLSSDATALQMFHVFESIVSKHTRYNK